MSCLIVEWPHTRALGERWFVYPPVTPSDQPRPTLKAFPSRQAAEVYADALRQLMCERELKDQIPRD